MEALTYIIKTGLLIFLFLSAMIDLRQKSLGFNFLCIAFTLGFLLQTIAGNLSLWLLIGGAALGGFFAVISLLSRQALGLGDSFLIGVCGAWLGLYSGILLLLCTFFILSAVGIFALALKKAKAKNSLPFAPFLLAGYIAVLAI